MQFDDIVTVIFMSHTTVAAIVALILDCSLSREIDSSRKDSGLNWWEKFSIYMYIYIYIYIYILNWWSNFISYIFLIPNSNSFAASWDLQECDSHRYKHKAGVD
jgi:hypothetical protein